MTDWQAITKAMLEALLPALTCEPSPHTAPLARAMDAPRDFDGPALVEEEE